MSMIKYINGTKNKWKDVIHIFDIKHLIIINNVWKGIYICY